jgi:hypothetical protein
MEIEDLVGDYTVNEQLLHKIRDTLDDYRYVFDFEVQSILLDRESIVKTMEYLLKGSTKNSLAVYTGSKST